MPGTTPRLSFDRLAATFDDQRSLPSEAVAALHSVFGELIDGGLQTMIEPGTGTGRIAIPALAAGFRVTALDISRPMLDAFASRLQALPEIADQCEFVTGDATDLPFDGDRFDVGVLAQVLYLIPDWRTVLDELVRVVKPDGQVMLVQERTVMSSELAQWDVSWREAMARAGYVAIPQKPDDATAVAALTERTGRVEERELASWSFGQTVAEALAALDRMRPLYESLSDDAWEEALALFQEWRASSGLGEDTRLDGTMTLVLASGSVPKGP